MLQHALFFIGQQTPAAPLPLTAHAVLQSDTQAGLALQSSASGHMPGSADAAAGLTLQQAAGSIATAVSHLAGVLEPSNTPSGLARSLKLLARLDARTRTDARITSTAVVVIARIAAPTGIATCP